MPTRRSRWRFGRPRWPKRRRRSRGARCSASSSIPAGTEREVLKGDQARLPAYVDSAYFLLYNRTLQGIQEAVGAVRADLAARSARPDGSLYRAALARSSPVEILNQPLFNPTGGYGSYIVPAAFLLILQQTLLMGSATLGGVAFEQGGARARRRRGTVAAVLGQGLAHLLLALPGFALFLVVLPRVYGFSASDRVLDLLVLAIPFILSVSFLGQFVGQLVQAAAKPRCCCSSPSACRSSSWSASPGRSKPSRRCLADGQLRPSEHVRHRRPGARQPDGRELWPTCRTTGCGCGCWPASTALLAIAAARIAQHAEDVAMRARAATLRCGRR